MTRLGKDGKSKDKNKVRYAVVGLGHIAQTAVLPAFKSAQNSELFALVSRGSIQTQEVGQDLCDPTPLFV